MQCIKWSCAVKATALVVSPTGREAHRRQHEAYQLPGSTAVGFQAKYQRELVYEGQPDRAVLRLQPMRLSPAHVETETRDSCLNALRAVTDNTTKTASWRPCRHSPEL